MHDCVLLGEKLSCPRADPALIDFFLSEMDRPSSTPPQFPQYLKYVKNWTNSFYGPWKQ